MSRPEIEVAIPIETQSKQLDKSVDLVNQFTKNIKLTIHHRPEINVAEARQEIMNNSKSRYICFLDYDSEMIDPQWLDKMYNTMITSEAAVVFPFEKWGSSALKVNCFPNPITSDGDHSVMFGPAACMLVDMKQVPEAVKWDKYMGLRNGWLGGDLEEVDWCHQMASRKRKLFRCTSTAFHHTGGKSTLEEYSKTDRKKSICVMSVLIHYKYSHHNGNPDFFKRLNYMPCASHDDTMLAPGKSMRDCFHDVIEANGLGFIRSFQKRGLV